MEIMTSLTAHLENLTTDIADCDEPTHNPTSAQEYRAILWEEVERVCDYYPDQADLIGRALAELPVTAISAGLLAMGPKTLDILAAL